MCQRSLSHLFDGTVWSLNSPCLWWGRGGNDPYSRPETSKQLCREEITINRHWVKELSKGIMKPILRGYGGKPCSAHLPDKCSLITMYYLLESQAVITRQEFSLKGEMREIGAGLLCFSLPWFMLRTQCCASFFI